MLKQDQFVTPLLAWYDKNKREMVWRDRGNAYYTWISEIMLQQTRIEAAKDYFVRFTEELPDIQSLANVPQERLLKLWEGLGYYNRAKNLQKTAKILVEEYGAELPSDYEKLLALPGIGPYTAGAIASIAYDIKVPAVDGNVLRVMMRYQASLEDITKISVRRRVEGELTSESFLCPRLASAFIPFTSRKITNTMIRKLITAVRNEPYFTSTSPMVSTR